MNQKIEIKKHANKESYYVIRNNPDAANGQNISARVHPTQWRVAFLIF